MSKPATVAIPLDELRRWMAERQLEAAYISLPVSIAYLTGFFADPHERLMGLIVRGDGVTLVVPALEREKANARAAGARVVAWRDGEDPYALVSEALRAVSEIGVEKEHLSVYAAEVITTRIGASDVVDVGGEIRRMRLIKSDEEIEKLARAAAITDRVTDQLFSRVRATQSETEVAFMISSLVGEFGGTLSFPSLVQSGPNSSLPHLEPSNRKLEPGDYVLLDFGAAVDGYKADTTRMLMVGEPSDKHREIHRIVLEAHDAAVAAVKPGATTGDIDAAARRVIDEAGYGPNFFHRIGHGLGLEGHEDPSLDPGSTTVLEAGMTFTIEPGVYVPGFGGVRIEDDVVVEQGGCRLLTQADRALKVI